MLLAIPFGVALGLAVGMFGGGGSVLAVPILVYVLSQSVAEATTASLAVVAAGAIAGGLSHAQAGRV
ncbi:MAG TPA: TSUP family transporter, partial [Solirubrobacteraceae bacterium]|nr:TSUP family transporter [Solirubrobacteraceae bacterium]